MRRMHTEKEIQAQAGGFKKIKVIAEVDDPSIVLPEVASSMQLAVVVDGSIYVSIASGYAVIGNEKVNGIGLGGNDPNNKSFLDLLGGLQGQEITIYYIPSLDTPNIEI